MEIWYVTDEQWEQLWEMLESPAKDLPNLAALFERPSIFKEV